MQYSIELHFDDESNRIIRNMWRRLKETNISNYMNDHGAYPHIALSVFNSLNLSKAQELLNGIASQENEFRLKMTSAGVFPFEEGVLFLAPTITEGLMRLHSRVDELFSDNKEKWEYYLPGLWVPHCTLGINIPRPEIHEALKVVLEDFKPFEITVKSLALVEFNPVRVIRSFSLINNIKF